MGPRRAMVIREATPADRAGIERLYRLLCPGEPVEVRAERLAEIDADPHNLLYVVDHDGVVVATAFLTLCLDPMFGRQPYAVLENVVVDPGLRQRGIGAALLRHIEACCRARQCSKIMLLSNARRPRAHDFFTRMGYSSAVSVGFKKYLGGHRPSQVPDAEGPAAR